MGAVTAKLSVNCNVSECSIREAAEYLEAMLGHPVRTYTLTVDYSRLAEHRQLLKRMQARYIDNPLAPYINILGTDKPMGSKEGWTLSDGHNLVGTEGV